MENANLRMRMGLSRRGFFTSAASGLGLAALASMLKDDGLLASENAQSALRNPQADPMEDPLRPKAPHFPARAKACIFIYLIGGVSHIDLFDPKPALDKLDGQPIPESFRQGIRLGQTSWKYPLMRSKFQFTRHGQCGMELSELIPHIGSVADDIALIRSMHHQAFDHAPGEIMTTAGKDIPGRPSIGSWLTYGLGSESQNLPGYVVMVNGRAPKSREMIHTNGFLPASHQGVLFRNDGSPILNLANPSDVTAEMHRAQLDAIHQLDKARYAETKDPAVAARIAAYELAFRMQKHAPELADMKGESKATIDSYGDGNFGRSLLLARRLVERGVRFVTVTHHEWDNHGNINEELPRACKQVDRPIATVIKDLKQRGLLDSTLVVCASEFGRTAIGQGDKTPGRDHHPHGYSVFLAGGGVRGGQVMGRTDDLGWRVTDEPVHINDFHATLLHLFGLDHKKLTYRHQGFDFRLTDVAGNVVEKLLA